MPHPTTRAKEALRNAGWVVREQGRSSFLAEADAPPDTPAESSVVVHPCGRLLYVDLSEGFTQNGRLEAPLTPETFARAAALRFPLGVPPTRTGWRDHLVELTNAEGGAPITDAAGFAMANELDVDPDHAPNGRPGCFVLYLHLAEAQLLDGSVTDTGRERIRCKVLA